jgi:DNA-binding Lrp family transcriptional regulator
MSQPRDGRTRPWREDATILTRLRQVEPLHIHRLSNREIGRRLGVSEMTIRRDVERLHELWLERTAADQSVLRAQVIAELDDVADRALKAAEWDHQAEMAVLYGVGVEIDGQPRQVYRDVKGAAQFRGQKAAALAVVRAARMDKAKVLGIVVDKPELTGQVLVRIVERERARDD